MVESSSSSIGFQLWLGEVRCTPSSRILEGAEQTSIIALKESYEQVEEKNTNIRENVASQLEAQSISEYHNRLL